MKKGRGRQQRGGAEGDQLQQRGGQPRGSEHGGKQGQVGPRGQAQQHPRVEQSQERPQGQQQPWGRPPPGQQGPPASQQQQSGPPQGQQQPWGRPPPGQQQQRGPPASQPQQSGPKQGQHEQRRPPQGQQQQRESSQSQPQEVKAVEQQQMVRRRVDLGDAELVSHNRIKPGTQCMRKIPIEVNHFPLNLGSLTVAYHYDVAIEPDKPKKFLRPAFEQFRQMMFKDRYPAFDGRRNCYAGKPLGQKVTDQFSGTVTLKEEDGREKQFKIDIKFAKEVDLMPLKNLLSNSTTPQDAIQVVDIVLRAGPSSNLIQAGRSFFTRPPPNGIMDLGEGMEMYVGFYQSAIRGWKPLLNVDVSHKAFPKEQPVIDALCELLSDYRTTFTPQMLQRLDGVQEDKLKKFVRTLRVVYQIPGFRDSRKTYRVNGLGGSAASETFDCNGKKMTIKEYFATIKNYRMKFDGLPTLWVGSTQKNIYVPLELCTICPDQVIPRKMTENQTSNMIKYAATSTVVRKQKIMSGMTRAQHNQSPSAQREFGFSVSNEMLKLEARVLTPPVLEYGNRQTLRVSKGVWRNDRAPFFTPVKISKWTFVSCLGRYPPRPDDYRRITSEFMKCAKDVGMLIENGPEEPYAVIGGRQTYQDCENYFRSIKPKNYDVVFVIIPDSGPQYSFVKKAAEIAVGCLTQCIKNRTALKKMNGQTAANILLKVNSKRNGLNHTISLKPAILAEKPIMIMGADVTHPGPDSTDIPSVAAVTASHDPKAFKYNICWRLQDPTKEIIDDLENITHEHLMYFFQMCRCKPEKIVFFRDGVSEGQFQQVRDYEIRAIRAACKRVQADGYEPKVTFLVVQKRHHTRFFPMNQRDSEDKNCNVPAGTCVDTEITHPFMQDFYLVSHASIQGVAKPTKYCTLWDDNNLSNDDVQQLAYYLCHMFARCNRSVSYPAPTYYAHLAAARAKAYIENDRLNMDYLQREFAKYQIKDEIRKGLPMFFV